MFNVLSRLMLICLAFGWLGLCVYVYYEFKLFRYFLSFLSALGWIVVIYIMVRDIFDFTDKSLWWRVSVAGGVCGLLALYFLVVWVSGQYVLYVSAGWGLIAKQKEFTPWQATVIGIIIPVVVAHCYWLISKIILREPIVDEIRAFWDWAVMMVRLIFRGDEKD